MQRRGSLDAQRDTSQGEKAVFRRRSIEARIAAKTTGAAAHGAGERPRPRAPRRTRPEVPRAALFWAASRAEPSRVRRLRQDSLPTAYMYTPSGAKDAGIGRSRKASTVARNKAAHWKASQHTANTHGCNEIFMQSQRVLAAEDAKDAELMPRSRPASGL